MVKYEMDSFEGYVKEGLDIVGIKTVYEQLGNPDENGARSIRVTILSTALKRYNNIEDYYIYQEANVISGVQQGDFDKLTASANKRVDEIIETFQRLQKKPKIIRGRVLP